VRTEKVFEGYVYHESFEKNGTLYVRYTKDLNDPYADCIELTEEDTYDQKTLYTGDILVEDPWFLMHRDTLTLLYPYSRMADVLPDAAMDEEYIVYLAASSDHALSAEEIKNTLVGLGIPAHNVTDYAAGAEENRSVIIIIQVFAYGFIILISLIAAANVFNTISTNIALRRREFAMLKSVGMTDRDFYKMMNYECLLYGSRSLLWGLPVSAAVSFVIHLAVQSGYETAFVLPLRAMAISCCSVFLVVFATMLYAVQKIRRDNPIDALKNENL